MSDRVWSGKEDLRRQRDGEQPGQSPDNTAALTNSSHHERLHLISGVRKHTSDSRSLNSTKQKPWDAAGARDLGTGVLAPPGVFD